MEIVPNERTPSQPIPRRTSSEVRKLGELRIPLAGPYRPRARLYLFPDGRLLWEIRLWEVDRPVARLVRTEVLRTYARRAGLAALAAEIDALSDQGAAESRRAAP